MSDALMEMKIMLTLRKHRLNEEFEALGDLFDIDKTTAQQYYAESKNLVSNLFHSLTSSVSSPILQESHDVVENPLQSENVCVIKTEPEDEESSSDSAVKDKYKGFTYDDCDVNSDDFEGSSSDESDYSEVESEDSYFESDELETKEKLPKEKVECPICWKNVGRLDYHMETIHLNPQHLNKTLCGLCFAKFETHLKLRAHQKDIHSGNSCVCDVCGKMFQTCSSVKEHILKVHSKVKPFLCDLCGSSFYSASKLKVHTQNAHLQIRNHECHLCDRKYKQAPELRAHIRSEHTKERPFKCRFEECGKSFCRSGTRHTHEQMHKVHFSCEICSKVFSFRHNLRTHCKNIHGKNLIDTEKCKIEVKQ